MQVDVPLVRPNPYLSVRRRIDDFGPEPPLDERLRRDGIQQQTLKRRAPEHCNARTRLRWIEEKPSSCIHYPRGPDFPGVRVNGRAQSDRLQYREAVFSQGDSSADRPWSGYAFEQGDARTGSCKQKRSSGAPCSGAGDDHMKVRESHDCHFMFAGSYGPGRASVVTEAARVLASPANLHASDIRPLRARHHRG